ncbi:Hypothetical predicted protein [Olea europaea subsp. europaea]|uniref:Uncharacterized protein n=1 Tax=Olea europaea subsp. europaea TaxID=158383 RepID=A0A8S0UEK4_OLEEU|nr:Hypothetical predicted protein [Olea europaea subsp. europaea]
MAWLRNANRRKTEPSAEELRETGKKHSIINYSAALERQSHIRQKERVFGVRYVTDNHHGPYSPPRMNLFEDHGDVVDDHPQFPRNMAYGSPPKERLKGAPLNSIARMKPSSVSRNDDYSSTDESDDDNYDRHGGYGGSYSPKMVRTKPEYDTDYGRESPKGDGRKPSFVPPAGRRQQHTAPVSTSPKKDTNHETARNWPIRYSPPRSKPETDTQSPKSGWKPLYEPTTRRHPQYSTPVSTSPENDMHYETANNRPIRPGLPWGKPESDTGYASDSPKAGGSPSFGFPDGRKPHHTFPTKDPRYETENNTAYDNGKGKTSEIPKPKYAQQSQVSPHPMTQPRKEDRQETIDSREARKRYGGKAINQPKREEEYTGTIDCIEAARKYNGIFVP